MAYKSIEKTDNFQTVVFDPSPTAPDMQALYEKGWVLHMGPFPVNRGFSALFFREKKSAPVVSLAALADGTYPDGNCDDCGGVHASGACL